MKNAYHFRTFIAALCALILHDRTVMATESYLHFWMGDSSVIGHSFNIMDHEGNFAAITGTPSESLRISEYENSETGEITWVTPDGGGLGNSWLPTGAWRIVETEFYGSFNPVNLHLESGTQFYLYDNNKNELSDPLWVDEGFDGGAAVSVPGYGIPELPIKVFGNKIKVLGGGEFNGKSRFDGPVRIKPSGDLSMGEFTHEPPF